MPESKITIRADSIAEAAAKFKVLRGEMAGVEKQAKLIRSEGLMMGQALRMNVAVDSQRAAAAAALTWQGRLKGVGASIMSIRGLMIGAGIYTGGRMLLGSMHDAAAADRAIRSFERLGGTRAGLNRMRDSVHGIATSAELAGAAARMMAQNQNLNAAAVEKLTAFAKRNSDVMGGELTDNMEIVNDALRTGRDISLKRIGLQPIEAKEIRALAAAEGIHTNKLDKTTESRLRTLAVLKQIDAVLAKHPRGAPTPGDTLTAMEKQWSEFSTGAGRAALIGSATEMRSATELMRGRPGRALYEFMTKRGTAGALIGMFSGEPRAAPPPEVKIKTVRASSIRLRDAGGLD